MEYNVSQLLKAPIGATQTKIIEEHESVLDEGVELSGPVEGEVVLLRTDAGILVQGDVSAEVQQECGRCLAPVRLFALARLAEEFCSKEEAIRERQEGDEPADPVLLIDENHTLDISDLVRQQLLLAVPSHPLCRADCGGICPQCGQDLNVASCDCEPEGDPRWGALAELQAELFSEVEK